MLDTVDPRYADEPDMSSHDRQPDRPPFALLLCSACFVALVISSFGVGTVTAQETTINATIDGDQLVQDGEVTVLEDPEANISVASETQIRLVEIRINGEIRHSYRPNKTTLSRTVPIELDPNENTLEVIAQSDNVKSLRTTVIKHTAAPHIRYSSPFSTTIKGKPSNETNLSTGQVTLAGNLHTVSTVERIRIERTHLPEGNNSTNVNREIHRIQNPGDSFAQDLLLGVGTNEIVAEYTDANGRTNSDRFRLIVDDATDPTISLNTPNSSYTDAARIHGTVRDETRLSKLTLNRTSNNASEILLLSSNNKPDPDKLSYKIDTTVELFSENEDNEFRLVAEDAAGNIRNQTFSIRYEPEPKVSITENSTNRTAGTVRVAGKISEAEIDRVTVETINTQSGDRLDLVRVYEAGTPTTTIEFDETLTAVPEDTVAKLLIEYKYGQEVLTIQPSVSTQQGASKTGAGTSSNRSDAIGDAESTGDVSGTNSSERSVSGNSVNNSTKSANEDSSLDSSSSPFTFIPIRTRDAFGGIIVVGAIYILGHWV